MLALLVTWVEVKSEGSVIKDGIISINGMTGVYFHNIITHTNCSLLTVFFKTVSSFNVNAISYKNFDKKSDIEYVLMGGMILMC